MMQYTIECHPTACLDGSIAPKQSDRLLSILSEKKQNQALKLRPLFVEIRLMELQQPLQLNVLQSMRLISLKKVKTMPTISTLMVAIVLFNRITRLMHTVFMFQPRHSAYPMQEDIVKI